MHELGFDNRDVCVEQLSVLHSKYLDLLRDVIPLILEPSGEKIEGIKRMEFRDDFPYQRELRYSCLRNTTRG